MANSPHSSSVSAPRRLEWRPSRLLCAILILLGIGAGLAVLASEMPRAAAWPLALGAALQGVRLARREARRPVLSWVFPASGPVTMEGIPVREAELVWRGPLAILHWRDRRGRRHRLGWWPDTLPAPARRELRLAAGIDGASRAPRPMAP